MVFCQTAQLFCHPDFVPPAVLSLDVQVALATNGSLILTYSLLGRMDQITVPPSLTPGFADGLWQYTCFEAFVAGGDAMTYREFNFSPSGQWAAYAFSNYRERDEPYHPGSAPTIAVSEQPSRLELEAVVPKELLPPVSSTAGYQLGLSAVIESIDGRRSYWALAHPGVRPDFHLRQAFTFLVPISETRS